ncbi:MAG TPA: ATP-dependent helicase [candidate division Zixibacteria bacterium]|nr:ATP-dependent helicase [candidate division Zixibacteria bacterium]
MTTAASVSSLASSLLASLDPEQRAAATLPDGPSLIIAPAGSGKTTTLIARLGVLLERGVPAERIAVATFNRDAALELSARINARLAPSVPSASRIEVRTLHALARQVMLDGRGPHELIVDRLPLLRAVLRRAAAREPPGQPTRGQPASGLPPLAELDTEVSAWKVEGREPAHRALVDEYGAMLAARRAMDFDDLVAQAVTLLETNPAVRARWQARFSHLCVDEFQDVDAGQLRLVRLLAEPQRNLFVVGDDDQTIYAWRLADVRRILTFESAYPGARRVQLATNYRCPRPVVAASARLIAVNRERFVKRIGPAPGAPPSPAAIAAFPTTAPDWPDHLARLAAGEAEANRRLCFLARTRHELDPVLLALVRAGVPHTTSVAAPVQVEPVRALVRAARGLPPQTLPFDALARLRAAHGWRRADASDALGDEEHDALDALMGWTVGFRRLDAFLAAHDTALAKLESLRRPDALVELVTVHAAKGREWETVLILGMEEDRFPNRRSLVDAADPGRALEEERRLAYVALTRATRRLILAFDPARPSRFLGEAGLVAQSPRSGATTER